MMINALIVDDEQAGRENLANLLNTYCENISILGTATNAVEARQLMANSKVDLLFLDIQMPNENGFDLLESINDRDFSVVFVSAYAEYAIRAIKASAIDYLLKPINISELKKATEKAQILYSQKLQNQNLQEEYKQSLQNFVDNLHNPNPPEKLTFQLGNELKIIEARKILHLNANDNYTKVYVNDERPFIISKTLKHFEDILDDNLFVRVHKSHIVNLAFVKKTCKDNSNHCLLMNDGMDSKIPIARRRYKYFIEKLDGYLQTK